jgi:serine/threonine protein kinase
MVCYELLTGLIPFDGHDRCDYDLILSGNRPALPRDLPEGVSKLVERCWEGNPQQRPEFTEIVEVLSSHLKGDPNHFSSGFHYNFFAESRS